MARTPSQGRSSRLAFPHAQLSADSKPFCQMITGSACAALAARSESQLAAKVASGRNDWGDMTTARGRANRDPIVPPRSW